MEDLEVFIVCHDQNIIIKNESDKKFESLKRYRYLFVGKGSVNLIENNPKVVICRRLKDNIEDYKYLVSFTAWYALAKNDLIKTKYVSVLEYDVHLSSDFYDKNHGVLDRTNGIIGYVVYPLLGPLYLSATTWLQRSLKRIYDIDVESLVNSYVQETKKNAWTSSSNHTMPTDIFLEFVDWFIPMSELFKNEPLGAHVHERSIKVFSILKKYRNCYVPSVLIHEQDKSHKIEAMI